MLHMLQEVFIPMSDLRFVVMRCAACGTEVNLDIELDKFQNVQRTSATPVNCPSCTIAFDSLMVSGIDSYRKFYKEVLSQKASVGFRVKPEVASQPPKS